MKVLIAVAFLFLNLSFQNIYASNNQCLEIINKAMKEKGLSSTFDKSKKTLQTLDIRRDADISWVEFMSKRKDYSDFLVGCFWDGYYKVDDDTDYVKDFDFSLRQKVRGEGDQGTYTNVEKAHLAGAATGNSCAEPPFPNKLSGSNIVQESDEYFAKKYPKYNNDLLKGLLENTSGPLVVTTLALGKNKKFIVTQKASGKFVGFGYGKDSNYDSFLFDEGCVIKDSRSFYCANKGILKFLCAEENLKYWPPPTQKNPGGSSTPNIFK